MIRQEPATIPIYSSKYNKYNNINFNPLYFNNIRMYEDEIFLQITSIVIPNILPIYYISNYGRLYNIFDNAFCNCLYDKDGYIHYSLRSLKDPYHIMFSIYRSHRLVLATFTNTSYFYQMEVNHIDLDKKNNNLQNLEFLTQQGNRDHAKKNNVFKSMTDEQAKNICKLLEDGYDITQISSMTNISRTSIQSIKSKKNFKSISSNYNLPTVKNTRNPLSEEEVIKICEMLQAGLKSQSEIACELNIPLYIINHIYKRDFFRNISDKYDFSQVKFINRQITDEDKSAIVEAIKNGETNNSKISRELHVTRHQVAKIRNELINDQ